MNRRFGMEIRSQEPVMEALRPVTAGWENIVARQFRG
jgi:hypothetical protein